MTNRTRKCKAIKDGSKCGNKFTAKFERHFWCGDECEDLFISQLMEKTRAKAEQKRKKDTKDKEKAEMAEHRKRKDKLKRITHFHKKAEKACNAYIRERDKDANCISCDTPLVFQDVYHAGHYKPQGSHKWIAYDEDNIHGQCEHCNIHRSGNLTEYRKRLVAKIGIERVERLENAGHHQIDKTYTREELLEIERYYKDKLKELKNG